VTAHPRTLQTWKGRSASDEIEAIPIPSENGDVASAATCLRAESSALFESTSRKPACLPEDCRIKKQEGAERFEQDENRRFG
jgi:hypothetical protein